MSRGLPWSACAYSFSRFQGTKEQLVNELINEPLSILMKSKHHCLFFPVVTAMLLALTYSLADDKRNILNVVDEKFIKQVASSGFSEWKITELGTRKAERGDIKECAEMMSKDYARINTDLKTLARSKAYEISDVPQDLKQTATFQKLEKKSGKTFDRAFLDEIEDTSKKVMSDFEEAASNSKDEDLKTFAFNTLPTLRNHLDKITELKTK